MRILTSCLIIFGLSTATHARSPDEIDQALNVIRGRIVFRGYDHATLMITVGAPVAVAGFVATMKARSLNLALPTKTWSQTFERASTVAGPPLFMAAGLAAVAVGVYQIQSIKSKRLTPAPVESYQTADGLNEFMGLPEDQQSELAHQYPELGAFLVDVANSYLFVQKFQFDPELDPAFVAERR